MSKKKQTKRDNQSFHKQSLVFKAKEGLIAVARALIKEPRLWYSRLILWLTPFAALFMVEIMNEKNPFMNLDFTEFVMNMAWYVGILFALWLICGRRRMAATIYMLLAFMAGAVNHFVLLYRGRILFPQDIATWKTAANVVAEYDLTPDSYIWGAMALLALWMVLIRFVMMRQPKREYFKRRAVTVALSALVAGYTIAFFWSPWLPSMGIKAQQWRTQSNGFVLNFSLALRYSKVEKPEGYSEQTIEKLAQEVSSGETQADHMTLYSAPYIASQYEPATADTELTPKELITVTNDTSGVQPTNIICIMDESFADMAIFDTLQLNEDTVPFYHSMSKNTIKGWMYSPVTGAGTANVEYEFLTSNSVSFLPDETTAYQLYVKENMPSLFSWARELGFETSAVHPYYSSGWNRVQVYNDFGVDNQLFNTDFENPTYTRGYISDESDFEMLKSITSKAEGDKQFIFNVTMQNHGGYRQGWSNLGHQIYLAGSMFGCSQYTEQYLNLMKQTDEQLEKLISYYSTVEEPTMIVFFGDHQGKLSSWFYEYKLYEKDLDTRTLEELEQMYVTPFFVWTNYDSQSATDVMLSTNYLGVLTAMQSNYPITGYMSYLSQVYEELPVLQTIGYINREGLLTNNQADLTEQQQELIDRYQQLSYYNLFSFKKGRMEQTDETFFLPAA